MDFIIAYLKGLLVTNPARLVGYGAIAAVWVFVKVALAVGFTTVPDDVTLAVSTVATFLLTELVRRLVYAPATVAALTAK